MTLTTLPHPSQGACYSRSTRTPLLMQWPSVLKAGSVLAAPVTLLDLPKTLLHAAHAANLTAAAASAPSATAAFAPSATATSATWIDHPAWVGEGHVAAFGGAEYAHSDCDLIAT